jgi:hypothetical protein
MDPRVRTSMQDLQVQHAAEVAMAASFGALSKADLQAHAVQEQAMQAAASDPALASQLKPYMESLDQLIDGLHPKAEAPAKPEAALSATTGEEPSQARKERPAPSAHRPGIDEVTDEATALYAELGAADAAPTAALTAASEHVEGEGREVLPVWEAFEKDQLPKLDDPFRAQTRDRSGSPTGQHAAGRRRGLAASTEWWSARP